MDIPANDNVHDDDVCRTCGAVIGEFDHEDAFLCDGCFWDVWGYGI